MIDDGALPANLITDALPAASAVRPLDGNSPRDDSSGRPRRRPRNSSLSEAEKAEDAASGHQLDRLA